MERGREFQREEELGTNECNIKKRKYVRKGQANYMDERNGQTCEVEIGQGKNLEGSRHSHEEF